MADKIISELKKATRLEESALLPVEQNGEAQALSGALLREFAENAVQTAIGDRIWVGTIEEYNALETIHSEILYFLYDGTVPAWS